MQDATKEGVLHDHAGRLLSVGQESKLGRGKGGSTVMGNVQKPRQVPLPALPIQHTPQPQDTPSPCHQALGVRTHIHTYTHTPQIWCVPLHYCFVPP